MRRFAAGQVDVLVATTVIEVGVDVAERDGDGDPRRRPVRGVPAASATGAGRPGTAGGLCLLVSDIDRRTCCPGPAGGGRRTTTASRPGPGRPGGPA